MPISGWIGCTLLSVLAVFAGVMVCMLTEKKAAGVAVTIIIAALIFGGSFWYYNNTASGNRERVDEIANFSNGLERTVTVYTADGTILKQYEGKIDIEQDQGYVKFDWNGKRYIYYNCYIETIADLP